MAFFMILSNQKAMSESKMVHIDFSKWKLDVVRDQLGNSTITSDVEEEPHYPDRNVPKLPWFAVYVDIESEKEFESFSYELSPLRTLKDIRIKSVPKILPTDMILTENEINDLAERMPIRYPENNLRYLCVRSTQEGNNRLIFLACPYIYDKDKEELQVLSGMDVEVKLRDSDSQRKLKVENVKDTIPGLISECLGYSESKNIDYVIITTKALAPAFSELISWKRKKGLNAAVIPLHMIYAAYSSAEYSPLTKIKKCIQTLKERKNLKYVLIGGDLSVVPSINAYCYFKLDNDPNNDEFIVDYSIPADIFFACFEGDYEWDANHNGIYGEVDDDIVFRPEVAISRLPLSTSQDILNYTAKLVSYESQIGNVCSIDDFLLVGTMLKSESYNNHYNIYYFNNQIINEYIKPFWSGNCIRVYDSLNDLNNGVPVVIDRNYFANLLRMGFPFINLICHGSTNSFQMDRFGKFDETDVANIKSKNGTIFFTPSCNTNNFRNVLYGEYKLCMSAEMLKNKDLGIVSYIGSNSDGLSGGDNGDVIPHIAGSDLFNAKIIRHLFSYDLNSRKLGYIISELKKELDLYSQYYSDYRWTELTQCLSGDCEMDVYTKTPLCYENVKLNNISGRYVSIESDDEFCIKVGKRNSFGVFEFYTPKLINPPVSNVNAWTFLMPDAQFAVSLTGDNRIPLYFIYNKNTFQKGLFTYLQSREIDEDMNILAEHLIVGRNVHKDEVQGDVIFKQGISVDVRAKGATLCEGTVIEQGCVFTINND